MANTITEIAGRDTVPTQTGKYAIYFMYRASPAIAEWINGRWYERLPSKGTRPIGDRVIGWMHLPNVEHLPE